MPSLASCVGFLAACCTTVSYFPQLKKCIDTGSADDLSLKMLLILGGGIGLWVVYGGLQGDWVIIIANAVSLTLIACLVAFKLRDTRRSKGIATHDGGQSAPAR